jgi:hypothetical protein
MPITMTSPSNAYHLTSIFFFLSFLSFFLKKKKTFSSDERLGYSDAISIVSTGEDYLVPN